MFFRLGNDYLNEKKTVKDMKPTDTKTPSGIKSSFFRFFYNDQRPQSHAHTVNSKMVLIYYLDVIMPESMEH